MGREGSELNCVVRVVELVVRPGGQVRWSGQVISFKEADLFMGCANCGVVF